jgi:hypothetical protein
LIYVSPNPKENTMYPYISGAAGKDDWRIVDQTLCEKASTSHKTNITCLLSLGSHLGRWDTNTVGVAEEQHTLALTSGTLGGLNPVAGTSRGPESLEETSPAGVGLSAVVVAHHTLDSVGGLIGVIEGNVADIVVQNVGLNDAVENVAANEAKVTVNSGSGTTGKVPHFRLVVGKSGISVLEESDGN